MSASNAATASCTTPPPSPTHTLTRSGRQGLLRSGMGDEVMLGGATNPNYDPDLYQDYPQVGVGWGQEGVLWGGGHPIHPYTCCGLQPGMLD